MREHHDVNVLADDNARGRVVRELRIVREAERLEESEGTRQISDRQIDEDLGAHEEGCSERRRTSLLVEDRQDRIL